MPHSTLAGACVCVIRRRFSVAAFYLNCPLTPTHECNYTHCRPWQRGRSFVGTVVGMTTDQSGLLTDVATLGKTKSADIVFIITAAAVIAHKLAMNIVLVDIIRSVVTDFC